MTRSMISAMISAMIPGRLARRLTRGARALTAFAAGQAGNSFMFFGLALPMVLGMAGLGFDATIWYLTRRENQAIADNASLAGIMALNRSGNTITEARAAAFDAAERHDFTHGADGDVLVNEIANCGPGGAIAGCLEVIVVEERPLYLASFVMDQQTTRVSARSVGAVVAFGQHCILALDRSMADALEVAGTADANIACGIASNSSSDKSIAIYGTAEITADPAQAYGDIYEGSNADLITETPPQPLSERIADPYYNDILTNDLIPPLSGACKSTDLPYEVTKSDPPTIEPNYPDGDIKLYCGGLSIMAGANVTMEPGVYVIDDGDFSVAGSATVTGVGVTIILTAWEPGNKINKVGNIVIKGGATVDLSAPTDGLYAGYLFIQDPEAPSSYDDTATSTGLEQNEIAGGATMILTGAIYAPTREVRFAGGAASADGGSACTQVVAKKVTITGNAFLENDPAACDTAGVERISQTRVRMVE